jgi:hypothetical protein
MNALDLLSSQQLDMDDFTLIPLNQILNKTYKSNWLIKNHMEQGSIGMLFGPPASAKSFIVMDIAFCIAAGIDWNGNDTVQGKVVYLAGEGHSGIAKRFKALGLKYSTTTSDIFFSELPASLMDPNNAKSVIDAINKVCTNPSLIVIDTLHRNFGSGDENSAKDFGKFLNTITQLIHQLGATVLLVHHSGHAFDDRARGSSSMRAAMDVEYKITKNKDDVTMICSKAKEFQEPPPMSFELVTQILPGWVDEDGVTAHSAILNSTTYTAPVRSASISGNDSAVLQALTDVITKQGKPASNDQSAKYPELAGKKYIHIEDWRKESYLLLDQKSCGQNKPQANQKAFKRAIGRLLYFNKIVTEEEYYWLAA